MKKKAGSTPAFYFIVFRLTKCRHVTDTSSPADLLQGLRRPDAVLRLDNLRNRFELPFDGRYGLRTTAAYYDYFSFRDMPLGASFRLRPFVVENRSITTPFWFFIVVAPAPPTSVPSAVAEV